MWHADRYRTDARRACTILRREGNSVDSSRALSRTLGTKHHRTSSVCGIGARVTATEALDRFVLRDAEYRYRHTFGIRIGDIQYPDRDQLMIWRPEIFQARTCQLAGGRLVGVEYVDRYSIRFALG